MRGPFPVNEGEGVGNFKHELGAMHGGPSLRDDRPREEVPRETLPLVSI